MENTRVVSELGAGFTNFSYVLGIVMLAIYLPLWVTSFDSVHKRMGTIKWKKLQKWSYVLYATLFIHAMGLQIGGMLNPRGGNAPRPTTEVAAPEANRNQRSESAVAQSGEESNRREQRESAQPAPSGQQGGQATASPARSGHGQTFGFSDVKVSPQTRRYIHISSLILIFGSYLYLRLRKAKRS